MQKAIHLPAPSIEGGPPVWEVLSRRRSIRDYAETPMPLEVLAQLLWSTHGITGKAGGKTHEIVVPIDLDESATHTGLPAVWARMKIADLYDQATYDPNPDLPGEIKQVALEYGLMSAYTAFVAVDSATRTAGTHGTTVHVPVPVPEGVRYETTVQERPSAQTERSERGEGASE